jgi:integrase
MTAAVGVRVKFYRGAWWIFINHHGRRRSKKVGDQQTAFRIARELRQRLASGDLHLPVSDGDISLQKYSADWLVQARLNLKASTVSFYEGHLEQHIMPMLGSRLVASLRRADCRTLVTICRAKGLKATTVRGIARTLSTILSQAVEDELLPANPALRLGKYLRSADDPEPVVDPFSRDETTHLLTVARNQFPEWYPWLLCGLRTGLRAGELLALQWSDFGWRGGFVQVQRNLVRGHLTTPKNHQRRRVDLSHQLQAALRLWRRRERRAWLQKGLPRPEWVFASVTGTTLDESNVRKALNRMLDAAGLHGRGPHQMRHTFASRLLQDGAPITYVSQQLGHKDAAITLRVYAHWLPTASKERLVDLLDDAHLDASQAHPTRLEYDDQNVLSRLNGVVSRVGIEPTTRRLRVCCSAN